MPEYVTDEALMQADRATVVLPCYTPAPIELTLAMSAARDTLMRVTVNGQALGDGTVGTEADATALSHSGGSALPRRQPGGGGDDRRRRDASAALRHRLLAYSPMILTSTRLGRRPSNSP
jgi:hypothetical protein